MRLTYLSYSRLGSGKLWRIGRAAFLHGLQKEYKHLKKWTPRWIRQPSISYPHLTLNPRNYTALAPTASSFLQSMASEELEEHVVAKVLFDFTATSEFELDMTGRPTRYESELAEN